MAGAPSTWFPAPSEPWHGTQVSKTASPRSMPGVGVVSQALAPIRTITGTAAQIVRTRAMVLTGTLGSGGRRNSVQRNRCVDEHDGDVVPDGIKEEPILTDQPLLDLRLDGVAAPVGYISGIDCLIQELQQILVRQSDRLLRLWTYENVEELLINHAFRCRNVVASHAPLREALRGADPGR